MVQLRQFARADGEAARDTGERVAGARHVGLGHRHLDDLARADDVGRADVIGVQQRIAGGGEVARQLVDMVAALHLVVLGDVAGGVHHRSGDEEVAGAAGGGRRQRADLAGVGRAWRLLRQRLGGAPLVVDHLLGRHRRIADLRRLGRRRRGGRRCGDRRRGRHGGRLRAARRLALSVHRGVLQPAPSARAEGPGGGSGWLSTRPTGATGGSASGSAAAGAGRAAAAASRAWAGADCGAFRLSSIGYAGVAIGPRGCASAAEIGYCGVAQAVRLRARQRGDRRLPQELTHRRILASHGANQSLVRP